MSGYFDGRNGRLSKTWRFRRSGKSVKTIGRFERFGRFSLLGNLLELELLPFYLANFEESPESANLAPSRGAVWGYPTVGVIYGASGVCTRCVRRYGSIW